MSRKNKVTVVLILLLLALAIYLIVRLAMRLDLEDVSLVNTERGTVFEIYDATKEKVGDVYYVKFNDVVASAANMDGKKYFRTDMTFVVTDPEVASALVRDKDMAVARMRNTMGTFRTVDVQDPRGKRFFKERIRRELSAAYGTEAITDVYFDNFVHD